MSKHRKYNILHDVSTVTTIPYLQMQSIVSPMNMCIAHAVKENLCLDNITVVDIGVGVIGICVDGDEIKYKFVPSEDLSKNISDALINKDPLVVALEKSLEAKILSAYKDFL